VRSPKNGDLYRCCEIIWHRVWEQLSLLAAPIPVANQVILAGGQTNSMFANAAAALESLALGKQVAAFSTTV
jgi:hypothetical protein